LKPKLVILSPYPKGTAGSQRFRYEHFLDDLEEQFELKYFPFLSQKTWSILYKPKYKFAKIFGIISSFIARIWHCISTLNASYVFIHREASPIGPPIFEFIIAKVFRKKIIFDFDDAIWLANTSGSNRLASKFKFHNKTGKICTWAYKVSCGNAWLANYANTFNSNIFIIPTVVNTDYHKKSNSKRSGKVCIGWTGTHSTLPSFEKLIPVLEQIYHHNKDKIFFKVIADKEATYPSLDLISTPWSKHNEIEELSELDIGLMPLENDRWSSGKCGFKAIQYMALGIPALVSPVGVNKEIVEKGVDGFHCETNKEWLEALQTLINNDETRYKIGLLGRKKIINNYSVKSVKSSFLSLFS
jgi:glycosyltransferase involved in cell wall biosynthesis